MNSILSEFDYLISTQLLPKPPAMEASLALVLKQGINWHYQQYNPEIIAVKNALAFDYITSDPTCYPLLKVYRTKDLYNQQSFRTVSAVISYSIAYPDLEKLPGILHFVAGTIEKILQVQTALSESCPCRIEKSDRIAEYRNMGDNSGNPVFSYIRIPFEFTEKI
jgi:hypothetical protein